VKKWEKGLFVDKNVIFKEHQSLNEPDFQLFDIQMTSNKEIGLDILIIYLNARQILFTLMKLITPLTQMKLGDTGRPCRLPG